MSKAELRDPQVKDLSHGELVIPPGELAECKRQIHLNLGVPRISVVVKVRS